MSTCPIKNDQPCSSLYEGGLLVADNPLEISRAIEFIPEQSRDIAKWISTQSKYESQVMVYISGQLCNEIGFTWHENFMWRDDPDFEIKRPTKFISAFCRKINRHLAKQTR